MAAFDERMRSFIARMPSSFDWGWAVCKQAAAFRGGFREAASLFEGLRMMDAPMLRPLYFSIVE